MLAFHVAFVAIAAAQFDWGSGCAGGKGAPFFITLEKGDTATVGTIPPGKFSVSIALSSAADLDVQLVAGGDEPIIAWCENKPKARAAQVAKGCGLLPSSPEVGSEESTSCASTTTWLGQGYRADPNLTPAKGNPNSNQG